MIIRFDGSEQPAFALQVAAQNTRDGQYLATDTRLGSGVGVRSWGLIIDLTIACERLAKGL